MRNELETWAALAPAKREPESLTEYAEGVIERAEATITRVMKRRAELIKRKPKGYTQAVLKTEKDHSAALGAKNTMEGLLYALENGQVDPTKEAK